MSRIESRHDAFNRGYRDAYAGKEPAPDYQDDDLRAPTRLLAYYTGYGNGCFARITRKLPTEQDKELTP